MDYCGPRHRLPFSFRHPALHHRLVDAQDPKQCFHHRPRHQDHRPPRHRLPRPQTHRHRSDHRLHPPTRVYR